MKRTPKDNMQIDLLDLGQEILRKVDDRRCDQLEIFLSKETVTTADIEKGSIKKGEKIFDMGLSARAVIGGSVGFAHSSSIEKTDVLEVIDGAIEVTKVMTPDPEFHSLPEAEPYPRIIKTPDKRVYSSDVEEAVEMSKRVMESARTDERVYSINTSVDLVSVEMAIVSTLGISAAEKDTYVGASANVVSKDGSEMSSGFEFQEARAIKDINLEWIGSEAANQSVRQLGARRTDSGELPVVFSPRVTASLISSGIAGACSAENVQKKRSYLTDKIGEAIANDHITVIDNGTLANGIATSAFDGEGVPRSETKIVEKGVLKSYLHNSYTSRKDGIRNTGNAVRGGGWDYRAVPSIGHTNLILTPGKGNQDDLVSELSKGILLLYTGDKPNLATGELSAQVTVGFKIEDGHLAYPLKQTTIGVGLLELMQNIDAIGQDSRQIMGVVAPSARVSKAMISGGT